MHPYELTSARPGGRSEATRGKVMGGFMVTPPRGLVLDPFMGSGSTLKAAELEGFSAIGIEMDAEYIELARRRIAADAPLFRSVEVSASPQDRAAPAAEERAA
jgi:hypothetical protein